MRNRIVFFDLETGGLNVRSTVTHRAQWEPLNAAGRAPVPAVKVVMSQATNGPRMLGADWMYTPPSPIIQIAAIACDLDTLKEVESFEVKLRFRPSLASPKALEANSYDPEVWAEKAVKYWDGLKSFADFLRAHATLKMTSKAGKPYKVAQLAGHNASSFDLEFLLHSFADPIWQRFAMPGDPARRSAPRSMFLPASFQVLDTLHLARWRHLIDPEADLENLKLETLAKSIGYDLSDAHDAMADVRATVEIARAYWSFPGGDENV